jgi:hypothetical protein
VLGRGKATHVGAYFGNDDRRCCGANSRDRLQLLHRRCARRQLRRDLRLDARQRLFQEIDMRQYLPQQDALRGIHPALQGLTQLRQFGP